MIAADTDRVIAMTRAVSAHEGLPPPALTIADLHRYALGPERLLDVFVAQLEGEVIGHVAATRGFDMQTGRPTRWLVDLYVEVPYRGKGVGRRLVAAVAAAADVEGATCLQWMIAPDNELAVGFYARLGARPDSGRPLYLGTEAMQGLAAMCQDTELGVAMDSPKAVDPRADSTDQFSQ
jgi:GNAT superfamily N-acetyltransferase